MTSRKNNDRHDRLRMKCGEGPTTANKSYLQWLGEV